MKTKIYILVLLASILSLGSCISEETQDKIGNDNYIHIKAFNGEQEENTRSTTGQKIYHKWNNGDILGLYAKGVLEQSGTSIINMGNQRLTANVSGNSVDFGLLPFQWNNETQDFYIYYPYQADSQTNFSDSQIKVSGILPSTQNQTGAYERPESNGHNFLYRIYTGIGKPGDGVLYLRDLSSFFPIYQFTLLCTDNTYHGMEVRSLEVTSSIPLKTGKYSIDLKKVSAGTSALTWDTYNSSNTTKYVVQMGSGVKLAYNMPVNIFMSLPPMGVATLTCIVTVQSTSGEYYTFTKVLLNQTLNVGKSAYTYILTQSVNSVDLGGVTEETWGENAGTNFELGI